MSREWPYLTGPGWWTLLDEFTEQAREIDPDAHLEFKEKYGMCRIFFATERTEAFDALSKLSHETEERSGTICELCGQPGTLRENNGWRETLCDRCDSLSSGERWEIHTDTEDRYFRGSYLRHETTWLEPFLTTDGHAWTLGVDLLHVPHREVGRTERLTVRLPFAEEETKIDCDVIAIDATLFDPAPPIKEVIVAVGRHGGYTIVYQNKRTFKAITAHINKDKEPPALS